jgi:hypothetical protein
MKEFSNDLSCHCDRVQDEIRRQRAQASKGIALERTRMSKEIARDNAQTRREIALDRVHARKEICECSAQADQVIRCLSSNPDDIAVALESLKHRLSVVALSSEKHARNSVQLTALRMPGRFIGLAERGTMVSYQLEVYKSAASESVAGALETTIDCARGPRKSVLHDARVFSAPSMNGRSRMHRDCGGGGGELSWCLFGFSGFASSISRPIKLNKLNLSIPCRGWTSLG